MTPTAPEARLLVVEDEPGVLELLTTSRRSPGGDAVAGPALPRLHPAEFHFWLHALLGGALGLSALAAVRLLRPGRSKAYEATLAGHLFSAVPDVLFLAYGVLHLAWMDVFALHITVHFLWPEPLVAAAVLWLLAVAGWTAQRLGHRRAAAAALLASVAFLASALLLRSPTPSTLQQVVEGGSNGSLGEQALSWVCRVEV